MTTKMRFTLMAACTFSWMVSCKQPSQKQLNFKAVISLDQELLTQEEKVINSSTQSINRYASSMRGLSYLEMAWNEEKQSLSLSMTDSSQQQGISIKNIDPTFLIPIFPYTREKYTKFDIANLILAEYARNGVAIPIQQSNTAYATVDYTKGLFDTRGEYLFVGGKYKPNPKVLPKRINIVNNCLSPGLWEITAQDAVGEMYHGWYTLPRDAYDELLQKVNGIPKTMVPKDFGNPDYFENVAIPLAKLRTEKKPIAASGIIYNHEKEIGGYSGQDSRRKVQRKFYEILRTEKELNATQQGQLKDGDVYSLFSFEPPGVYNNENRTRLTFVRQWDSASVVLTEPKTVYPDQTSFLESEYIEIRIFDQKREKALLIGNVPLSLLTFSDDFEIPAFGVGVFKSSENIERRYLRKKEGPKPSFAYLSDYANGRFFVINNHHFGYEQLYLRPRMEGDKLFLTVTIVSYERITDLVEFEIDITPLKDIVIKNSEQYHPPIYTTYLDDNTL